MNWLYDGIRNKILSQNNDNMSGSIMDNLPMNSPKLITAIRNLKGEDVLVLCGMSVYAKSKLEDKITDNYTNSVFLNGFVDTVEENKSKGYFLKFALNAIDIKASDISLVTIYDIVRANDIRLLKDDSDKPGKLKIFSFYLLEESAAVGEGVLGFRVEHYDPFNAFNEISSDVNGKPVRLSRIQHVLPRRKETIMRENYL